MESSTHAVWVRCASVYRWCGYLLYALYTCALFLWEVVAGVLEIPTDAPQYDALLRQASCATSYEEWLPVAAALDDLDGFQQWRTNEQSPYFSFEGVMRTIEELLELRSTGDAEALLEGLHKRVHRSLCGISHHRLYAYRTGTKTVIHSYTSLVCFLLGRVGETARLHPRLQPRTRAVLTEMHHVYGTTALLLQGGVLAAAAHLGVAQALFDAGLLPPVIYGSGSGALVATLVCCSADLPRLFTRVHHDEAGALVGGGGGGNAAAARRERWRRLLHSGEVVDPDALADFLQRTVGDVTFAEAYARTGRVLNIPYTAAPSPLQRVCGRQLAVDQQLLNYLTAPDVLVRSAVRCAMCATPRHPPSADAAPSASSTAWPPLPSSSPPKPENCSLLARPHREGDIVVYDPSVVRQSYPAPCGEHAGVGARDPVQRMCGLFAIRFSIVSDASLRGYVWRQLHQHHHGCGPAAAGQSKVRLWSWLRYGCALCCLGLAAVVLRVLAWLGYDAIAGPSHTSLNSMLQQDEGESMQIYPVPSLRTFLRLWFSPTAENMTVLKTEAQREVWPRLEQLRISMSVEQVLAETLKRLPTHESIDG